MESLKCLLSESECILSKKLFFLPKRKEKLLYVFHYPPKTMKMNFKAGAKVSNSINVEIQKDFYKSAKISM